MPYLEKPRDNLRPLLSLMERAASACFAASSLFRAVPQATCRPPSYRCHTNRGSVRVDFAAGAICTFTSKPPVRKGRSGGGFVFGGAGWAPWALQKSRELARGSGQKFSIWSFAGLFAGSCRIHAIRRPFPFDGMAPAARRDCRFFPASRAFLGLIVHKS